MNTRALKLGGKRKPIVVANWKMNPQSLREAKALFNRVKKTNAIICPPSVYLSELKAKGAQDCFLKKRGTMKNCYGWPKSEDWSTDLALSLMLPYLWRRELGIGGKRLASVHSQKNYGTRGVKKVRNF